MSGVELPLAVAALLLALIAVVVALTLYLRLNRLLREQHKVPAQLQSDLRALVNSAVQVGKRLRRMELQVKLLQQRQEELGVRQDKMAQVEAHEAGYDQAVKLARKGASVEELMEICNLSRGEAELIAMMHRLDSK